jgi:hypothetical protein
MSPWYRRAPLLCAIVAAVACAPLRREVRPPVAHQSAARTVAGAERRLVVELAPGQTVDVLVAAAAEQFGAGVDVQPLFPTARAADDPFDLGAIYLVRIPGAASPPEAWEEAYALKARGGFANVEPDLADTLERPTRSVARACFGDEGVPAPSHKGWALVEMRAPAAWMLEPPTGGKRFGEGVRVCHIDTGWTDHADVDRDRLDLAAARDLVDDDDDARDPLDYDGNPGHGTATGSVIASSGGVTSDGATTAPGEVTGVAPRATVVPIRTIKSVVQFLDTAVASAVRYSTDVGCDVISMSLGGRAFFGLERAIKDAVARDVIVVAAAGNCVGFVVAPALYDDTLAVAATNVAHEPWRGSSHGTKIALAAPGEDVYVARRSTPTDATNGLVEPGNGTSFATAELAGAAALWVAFHGREALETAAGAGTRQALFARALETSVSRPAAWDGAQYGTGILDVAKLLAVDPSTLMRGRSIARPARSTPMLELLARSTGVPREQLAPRLEAWFGRGDANAIAEQWGPELLFLAANQPEAMQRSLRALATRRASRRRADARAVVSPYASRTLSAALE